MPIRVGDPTHWKLIQPSTNAWRTMPTVLTKYAFAVDTNFFYVNVDKM